ncbi:MAG: dTDP-4-dehydrorhamnose reductase [bacterium]|nr:dTDP-4-dehydrorhamnose reductase [bacterium]
MTQLDYLVTGATGQLGRAVLAEVTARGKRAFGVGSADMPLERRAGIASTLMTHRPRCVLHCGAMTNVDGCEQDPLLANRINGLATAWIADVAAAIDAALIYVSTDFVFEGRQHGRPYAVDASVAPLSAYGRSKRLGEEAVLAHERPNFQVVRTSWVFGPGGRNFPRAILARARSGQPLKVVTDQVGCPTYAPDLAAALLDLDAAEAEGGIYHATNTGHCSWHEFATAILAAAGLGEAAVGTQVAADLGLPAPRPEWSVLDNSRLETVRGKALPEYRDAIDRYLAAEDAGGAAGSTDSCSPVSVQSKTANDSKTARDSQTARDRAKQ